MITRNNFYQTSQSESETGAIAKNFISNVFSWMAIALAITAFTSWYFANSTALMSSLFNPETGMTILGWIVMLSPLGFVFAMSMGFQKFSSSTLTILFGIFSILMGMSLSFILLIYTASSIFQTFAVTAGMFGFMAFLGYTTKTDLTKFGSLLMMGYSELSLPVL